MYEFDAIEDINFNSTNLTPIIVDDKQLFKIVE